MTEPLAGLAVLVTRPRRQAGRFIELASRAGARCIALPTLEIEPLTLDAAARERLAPDAHDWAIYTSANAVEAACLLWPRPERCKVAAVGRATARALETHGIRVDALPPDRSDSEGLLALPGFAEVVGRKILILRGIGGREWLREQLTLRGARVQVAEVYRRKAVVAEPGAIQALEHALQGGTRLVVAVTSVEILEGLLGLVPQRLATPLRSAILLAPGERVAAAARARHWTGEIVVAPSAEDPVMLARLVDRLGARGAPPPA